MNRDELASEYVLGTLSADERHQAQELMRSDPTFAELVRAWEHKLLPLTQLVEPIEPPPRLWQQITHTLQWDSASKRPAPGWRAWWNSLPLWRGLTAGTAIAAVTLVSVLTMKPPEGAPRFVVVLVAPQDKAPGWVIQASARQQVSLIPLGSFDVPPDKALQFWTKADDWQGPVSLGLVQPGQRVQIPLDRLPPLQPNQLFELTLEPKAGSPIGKPTGPIQFIGRAVPVT